MMNRRAVRITCAGSAAAIITLLCWFSGIGVGIGSESSRADLVRQVSNLSSGVSKAYAPKVVVDTYDKSSPPGTGCAEVVSDLQTRIIEAYSPLFEGIRHINMFGYLGMSSVEPVDSDGCG